MSDSYYRRSQRALAEVIRTRRQQLGLTQEEAAHAMQLATRHYQKLEAGELNVTLKTLARVAQALGLEIGELFGIPGTRE